VDNVGLFGVVGGALTGVRLTGRLSPSNPVIIDVAGLLIGELLPAGTVTDSQIAGTILANTFVGGIAGLASGTISRSSSSAQVTGANSVGGLVGSHLLGALLEDSYCTGRVEGEENVGGITGLATDSTITNVYYSGVIQDFEVGGQEFGRTIGFDDGATVTNAYHNSSIAPEPSNLGLNTVSGESALNAGQMATQGSFIGFTFPSTWVMDIFPILQWQAD
jgi:hypothetical protein